MKEIYGMALRTIAVLVVIVGLIEAGVGLFFLEDTMISTEYNMQTKLETLFWLYIMVEGIATFIFGFYGAFNALDGPIESMKKCVIYGMVMMAFCTVNGVLIAVKFNFFSVISLVIVFVPAVFSVLYTLFAFLKMRGIKNDRSE